MKNEEVMETLKKNLIVSCQALEDEPLHSSFIMGRMALAAKEGGASGIRANTAEDITEIKKIVDLPVIGIIKKEYPDSNVYITPTMDEIDALVQSGAEIIALDATLRMRPKETELNDFFKKVKEKYPKQMFMADIATTEEAENAEKLGFDFVGTTLHGYTENTKDQNIADDDFKFLKDVMASVSVPVIAEGKIDTPEKAKRVLELGVFCVVVGGAITRPQLITKTFSDKIKEV
ncbi:N-acetylmannosamine-6-phosphate 2-epimerase [Sebaldella sp. S0638]|uniref:N-acetylmannosamine-6-phosphate 2-epimerase n=1 Tax=Sebaldella sp. S0638 TaxID=2957809 RepID=UPI00209ED66F|nr:N-acetylmannosamine-6-phosphate 2-epimerase [Sebaldella sp. S0638]MCP1223368.1 N-acetylmannosamine-6-phosphate 2-epimerase [Sebaldella sp. S0638]